MITREEAEELLKILNIMYTNHPLAQVIKSRLDEPPCKTGSQCVGNKCDRCKI